MPEIVEHLIKISRLYLVENPTLFVVGTGLLIAVLSVAGEFVIYWAVRLGGRPMVDSLTARGWIKLNPQRREWTDEMFQRWGVQLVVFGRILPGVRSLVSIPAGLTRMNFGLFAGAAFSGATIWNTLLVAIGYSLGLKVTLLGVSILG